MRSIFLIHCGKTGYEREQVPNNIIPIEVWFENDTGQPHSRCLAETVYEFKQWAHMFFSERYYKQNVLIDMKIHSCKENSIYSAKPMFFSLLRWHRGL